MTERRALARVRIPAAVVVAAILSIPGCRDGKGDGEPHECQPGQLAIGGECLDGLGPESCAGLLVDADHACVPGVASCADDEVYEGSGCAPVGERRDCGTGTWGGMDTSGSVVYVDASYGGGSSDGTSSAPFTTITEAIAVAAPGDKVAVAEGTYGERVSVPAGVTLEGRCASLVTLAGDAGPGPTISIDGADGAAVVGITVEGEGTGIDIASSDGVGLSQVVVRQAAGVGIRVRSGDGAIIGDCGIRETRYLSVDLQGVGIMIESGATTASVSSTIVSDSAYSGVLVDGGGAAFDRLLSVGNGAGGATVVSPSSAVEVLRSRFSTNGWAGIYAMGDGSISVEDSVVEGSSDVTSSDSANGDGVVAVSGMDLTMTGCVVRDNARFGVIVGGAAGIIGDCGIFDNGADPRSDSSAGGIGVLVDGTTGTRGSLELSNTTVSDNTGGGILSWGSDLDVGSATVSGNAPRSAGTPEGDGIMASEASSMSVTGTLVDGGGGGRLGVLVDGDGSNGIIGDCGIRGTEYAGVWFQDSAGGSVEGSVIADVKFAGIGLAREAGSVSPVEITGTTIAGVGFAVGLSESGSVIDWGDGIAVLAGSSAGVTGNTVREVDRSGIIFDGSGGSATGNTISGGEWGIATQNLGGMTVTGATAHQNSISDVASGAIASDLNLPVDVSGWTAGL